MHDLKPKWYATLITSRQTYVVIQYALNKKKDFFVGTKQANSENISMYCSECKRMKSID